MLLYKQILLSGGTIMDILLNEINKALKSKCWLAALSLSLSIPDIGGKLEYPEITGKGSVGRRYRKWYNYYSLKYYKLDDNFALFTGEQCYLLRCNFFHDGNNHNDSKVLSKFQFSTPEDGYLNSGINSYYESNQLGKRLVIDIAHLSQVLVLGANEWRKTTQKDLSSLKEFSFYNPSTFYY